MSERLPGWESRLAAALEAARARPYELGVHDCFRLACVVIEALTGVDRWPEFRGTYRSRREALVRLAHYGSSWRAAGDAFFGAPAVPALAARRGDICSLELEGESHLGVCTGAQAAMLCERGLLGIALERCDYAWRVG